jgi:hypothetical protein
MKMNLRFSFVFSILWVLPSALAQVLSPSGREVKVQYEARFEVSGEIRSKNSAFEKADLHSSHVFALLKTTRIKKDFRLRSSSVGVGAPRLPSEIEVLGIKRTKGPRGGLRTEISYRYSGTWLLLEQVAQAWVQARYVPFMMPYALDQIYDPKCTDDYYNSLDDYWYFYDPYKRGCEYLLQEPYHALVQLRVTPMRSSKKETRPPLRVLRGDNRNGEWFRIDVIHGFAENSRSRNDEGRMGFEEFDRQMMRRKFQRRVIDSSKRFPIFEYIRGSIVIRSSLVDSEADAKSDRFAIQFKEAVENADVIAYLGHSGLGGNLDIEFLESRVGEFNFIAGKKQIFYFDSCSSYSYYLQSFLGKKRKSDIDIITNGLESYFYTAIPKLMVFIDTLIHPESEPTWLQLLEAMESTLKGNTYLLNVGGV